MGLKLQEVVPAAEVVMRVLIVICLPLAALSIRAVFLQRAFQVVMEAEG